MIMQARTRTRKPAQPVHGSVRWLKRPVLPLGIGRLSITSNTARGPVTVEYDLGAILDQGGRMIGYRLVKDDDAGYNLSADLEDCDCPDRTCRGRECKHLAAVRAALKGGG